MMGVLTVIPSKGTRRLLPDKILIPAHRIQTIELVDDTAYFFVDGDEAPIVVHGQTAEDLYDRLRAALK